MFKDLKTRDVLIIAGAAAVGLAAAYFIGEVAFIGGRYKGWKESETAFNAALEKGFQTTEPSSGVVAQ